MFVPEITSAYNLEKGFILKKYKSASTICVHSGTIKDEKHSGSVSPLYSSSAYEYLGLDKRSYPRYFNTPNQESVTEKISALEHGQAALVFSSGMAAISTTLLSLLHNGDHAVFQKGLYGGTTSFIHHCFDDFNLSFSVTEGRKVIDFEKCIKPETKVIYIETPSNPLLNITDIASIVQLAKSRNIVTLIDNTFASPINQKPIDLGIDVALHSATKYLGGHSDICAGVVVSSQNIIKKIGSRAKVLGGSLNAQMCHLLERSIKTMALRVEKQNKNAGLIADFLEKSKQVERVYYPGLENHPDHKIAKKQMSGFGGMLSFELKSGMDHTMFQKELKLIKPVMSLGGVESTICSSALTSHAVLSKEQREAEGISDSLLRLSVGIESGDELIADLERALNKF